MLYLEAALVNKGVMEIAKLFAANTMLTKTPLPFSYNVLEEEMFKGPRPERPIPTKNANIKDEFIVLTRVKIIKDIKARKPSTIII